MVCLEIGTIKVTEIRMGISAQNIRTEIVATLRPIYTRQ